MTRKLVVPFFVTTLGFLTIGTLDVRASWNGGGV